MVAMYLNSQKIKSTESKPKEEKCSNFHHIFNIFMSALKRRPFRRLVFWGKEAFLCAVPAIDSVNTLIFVKFGIMCREGFFVGLPCLFLIGQSLS